MHIKILLPSGIFTEMENVFGIIAETTSGMFGILPGRLDCTAVLVPGIFTCKSEVGTQYFALDEGMLVKTGNAVLVSVHNAVGGVGLGALRNAVESQFLALDENEKSMRDVLAKLESSLVRTMQKFSNI